MSLVKGMTVKLPLVRPDGFAPDIGLADTLNALVDVFFWWCVWILQVGGEVTGLGYNLLNIVVFVVGQPLLIALFALLWWMEKKRNRHP